ncbi:hypothetical protein [Tahibacter sp.]|uniref:hypothetical protein n=1 Tax=Tahibacter sp. TaxID=2056211 RepID=UPI0028C3B4DD|nr:hypothetical protein [Tahibacter sp.]
MLHISRRARLLACLMALALLVPVAGLRLQTTQQLEQFHRRTLHAWPANNAFAGDPVAWFRDARAWLVDRAYPIRHAAQWRRQLLLHVLHTSPQGNIALGDDGFIFLTGVDENTRYSIIEGACINAHTAEAGAALRRALAQLAQYSERSGIAVDVVVLPTLLTMYPERLPNSIPQIYRDACAARGRGESPLLDVAAPAGLHYSFPMAELRAARDDPAFFPQANWHAYGLSVKVARDSYLRQLGLAPPSTEHLKRVDKPSEILLMHGFTLLRPAWQVDSDTVAPDASGNDAFRAAIADLAPNPRFITYGWKNSTPLRAEKVLMVSDSYGQLTAPLYTAAFSSMVQITANDFKNTSVPLLVQRTRETRGVDRLILLVHDGGIYRIFGWASALQRSVLISIEGAH